MTTLKFRLSIRVSWFVLIYFANNCASSICVKMVLLISTSGRVCNTRLKAFVVRNCRLFSAVNGVCALSSFSVACAGVLFASCIGVHNCLRIWGIISEMCSAFMSRAFSSCLLHRMMPALFLS